MPDGKRYIKLRNGIRLSEDDVAALKRSVEVNFHRILSRHARAEVKQTAGYLQTCCPLHGGKKSRFYFFIDSGLWSCFTDGCGQSCDVIAFFQKMYHCDFADAVLHMYEEVGSTITLEPPRPVVQEKAVAPVQVWNEAVLQQFQGSHFAWKRVEPWVREHLEGGYCGHPWHRLYGRITLPVRDLEGNLVGVIGRTTHTEFPGHLLEHVTSDRHRESLLRYWRDCKYLHFGPSDHGSFSKSRVLFHGNKAKDITGVPLVVVEGPFDAARVIEHGYRAVVACMGSHVSNAQWGIIKSISSYVICGLDPDTHTTGAYEVFLKGAHQHGIVTVPLRIEAKDPGDTTKIEFKSAMREALWELYRLL